MQREIETDGTEYIFKPLWKIFPHTLFKIY